MSVWKHGAELPPPDQLLLKLPPGEPTLLDGSHAPFVMVTGAPLVVPQEVVLAQLHPCTVAVLPEIVALPTNPEVDPQIRPSVGMNADVGEPEAVPQVVSEYPWVDTTTAGRQETLMLPVAPA